MSLILIFAVLFSTVSCSFLGVRIFSLEFTLTDEDYEYFERKAFALFEDAQKESAYFKVVFDLNGFVDSYDFISTQTTVAYVNYCKDTKSEKAISDYKYATAINYKARELYIETLQKIIELDNSVSEALFAEWSEEEKAEILSYDSGADAFLERNELILIEFDALDKKAEGWRDECDALYDEFFDNNRTIAELVGYDNYYDYAAEKIHLRDYSSEERVAFREYVKTYIAPLYKDIKAKRLEVFESASEELKNGYNAIVCCNYDENEWETDYIIDYIGEYDGALYAYLINMYYSEGMVIGDGENAMDTAFTTILRYYSEPLAYFGNGYRDMLTVVHENGHYAAMWQSGIFSQSLDVHEIHSQGNEWMFVEYLEGKIDSEIYEMLWLDRLTRGLGNIVFSCAVDEMEEMIYRGEKETISDAARAVAERYEGVFNTPDTIGDYFRNVAMKSPVYYISYATSELVSVGLYTVANEDFDRAKEIYSSLVLDTDSFSGLLGAVDYCGLPNPFSEETFEYIKDAIELEDEEPTENQTELDAAA